MQRTSFTIGSKRKRLLVAGAVILLVTGGTFGVASAHDRGGSGHHRSGQSSDSKGLIAADVKAIAQAYKAGDQTAMDTAVDKLKTDLDASLAAKNSSSSTTTTAPDGSTTTTDPDETTTTTSPDDTTTTTVPDETTTTTVDPDETTTTTDDPDVTTSTTVEEPAALDVSALTASLN